MSSLWVAVWRFVFTYSDCHESLTSRHSSPSPDEIPADVESLMDAPEQAAWEDIPDPERENEPLSFDDMDGIIQRASRKYSPERMQAYQDEDKKRRRERKNAEEQWWRTSSHQILDLYLQFYDEASSRRISCECGSEKSYPVTFISMTGEGYQ